MEGEDISKGLRGLGKNGQKKGDINLYNRFGIIHGGLRPLIKPINHEQVCGNYHLIVGKVMKDYSKGE